jgi:hypothetical protein
MSKKKIKVKYETFYTLTPDASEALGVETDADRPTTMAEIVQAGERLREKGNTEQCKTNKPGPPKK